MRKGMTELNLETNGSGTQYLRIGDLARRSGKTVRAIHLYEELKMLLLVGFERRGRNRVRRRRRRVNADRRRLAGAEGEGRSVERDADRARGRCRGQVADQVHGPLTASDLQFGLHVPDAGHASRHRERAIDIGCRPGGARQRDHAPRGRRVETQRSDLRIVQQGDLDTSGDGRIVVLPENGRAAAGE